MTSLISRIAAFFLLKLEEKKNHKKTMHTHLKKKRKEKKRKEKKRTVYISIETPFENGNKKQL